jgi:DNA mismatch endonuclease, patch repair protein
MTDTHEPAVRSYNMSRIRSKNTKPELKIRKFLFENGFRYRLHVKKLPGKPDIVLSKYRTAIFVNGCFWHGYQNCSFFRYPKTHINWWKNKLDKNVINDHLKQNRLIEMGYRVLIIWECEIKNNSVFEKLVEYVKKQ